MKLWRGGKMSQDSNDRINKGVVGELLNGYSDSIKPASTIHQGEYYETIKTSLQ